MARVRSGGGSSGRNDRARLVIRLVRRDRAGLLRTTALQAAAVVAFFAPHAIGRAQAQPAPTARPTGGQVVGGQASISQTTAQTSVVQGSQRAAIDWRSYDVGSQHTVAYQQPNSSAVVLNRVTGPDPSQVAGRITANGQVIITNQSGVVFHQGAQVDAAGLVVSAPGITNQNFMAGRMVFDQAPRPDAQVVNRGSITVKEAGLAALVAPRVANSGTITARMGRAVLAGAETHTVDLYGDGLLSIDVTGKVRQAPRGTDGKPVTALVTNTGTVAADGGTVTITAAAADGIVTDLVQAGGHVRANTVGNRQGRIEVAGTGGSLVVEGRLAADGNAPGATGGSVTLNATGAVTVAPGAHVTASGSAGGGTVAVGTALARARGGPAVTGEPTAARVTVAQGARIAANARRQGNGGTVTLLSSGTTALDGSIAARGGRVGGGGGTVEISGGQVGLNGRVDASAPHGRLGRILLDPYDLEITTDDGAQTITPGTTSPQIGANDGPASGTSYVKASSARALTGDVELQAMHDVTLDQNANLAMPNVGQSITLTAGNKVTISLGSTISGGPYRAFSGSGGQNGGSVTLTAGAGGISLLGTVSTAVNTGGDPGLNGGVILTASNGGAVTQGAGSISTYSLSGSAASAQLDAVANSVSTLGFTTSTGGFALRNVNTFGDVLDASVTVPAAQAIRLVTDSLTVSQLQAPGGTVTVEPVTAGLPLELTANEGKAANTLSLSTADISGVQTGTFRFGSPTAGNITVTGGTVDFGSGQGAYAQQLNLLSGGSVTVGAGASLAVQALSGQAASVTLAQPASANGQPQSYIPTLAGFTTMGDFKLDVSSGLNVTGPVKGTNVNLSATGGDIVLGADVTATAAGGYVRLDASNGATTRAGAPDLSTSGSVRQTAGVVSADRLSGTAYAVDLTATYSSVGNRIGQVGFDQTDPVLGIQLGTTGTYGDFQVSSASGFAIGGPVSSQTGTIALYSIGAITQAAAGTLSAQVLTGRAMSAVLDNPGNSISTLGSFTTTGATTGTFSLATSGDLLANGPVTSSAGTLTLTSGGSLTLAGNVSANPAGGTVTLNSGGATTQTGGIITAGTLTGQAGTQFRTTGDVFLPGANRVGVLGNYTATSDVSATPASFTLFSDQALRVSGTVATLRSNSAVAAGSVSLSSSAGITQDAASSIQTASLTGTAASAAFTSSANHVAGLSGYSTSAGGLSLYTQLTPDGNGGSVPLVVTGTNSVPAGQQITLRADQMAFPGESQLSAPQGTVLLAPLTPGRPAELVAGTTAANASALSIPQAGLGTITTGTLQVGVADTGAINVSNPGEAISLAGVNTLRVVSAAAVTQGAGATLTVPVVAGIAASVSLPGANGIGTLADFAATGTSFALNSAQVLTVTGPVTAVTTAAVSSAAGLVLSGDVAAPGVTLATTGGGLSLASGTVTGTTATGDGTVRLDVAGNVTQTGGVLVTDLLQGSAGSLSLPSAANQVATLGPFTATAGTGSLLLRDGRSLTVGGAVSASDLTLDVAGGLAVNGTVTGGTVALAATGAITEGTGGQVSATTLMGSALSAQLPQAQVGTLAGFTTTGGFLLRSSGTAASNALVVTGPVTDQTSITLGTQGPLTLRGDVTAPVISLTANRSGVPAPAGAASARAFAKAAVASGSGTGTTLRGTITQESGTVSGTAQVSLLADDAIVQTGGRLLAGTLTGASGRVAAGLLDGTTTLASSGNLVGTLGSFSSVGGFALVNGQALQVSGTVQDAASVSLTAAGDLSQPGGSIQTGALLASSSGGGVGLTSASNQVTSLGASSGAAGFALTDGAMLNVTGAVQAGGTGRTLALTADAIQLQPGGSLTASGGTVALAPLTGGAFSLGSFVPSGTVSIVTADTLRVGTAASGPLAVSGAFNLLRVGTLDLRSGGAVTEAADASLQVGRLTGGAASAALDGANLVGTLGAFSTAGGFRLQNGAGLTVAGPVTDSTGSITIGASGPILLQGDVAAPSVSLAARRGADGAAAPGSIVQSAGTVSGSVQVSLQAADGISQTGGTLVAGALTGSSGDATSLASAGNLVGTLSGFGSAGGFFLRDGQALQVSGTVRDSTSVGLSATGSITQASTGGVVTGTLSASSSAGSVGLASAANQVGALGTSGAAGDFALVDGTALDVRGAVTAGTGRTLSLTSDTISLQPGGSLAASGGTVALAPLTGGPFALASSVPASTAAVVADTLRVGSQGAGPLAVSGTFGLAQVGTLDLRSGGAVTEAAGASLQVGRLTGSAASAALDGPNQVGALSDFAATRGFSLSNARDLAVSGAVRGGTAVRLSATGALAVGGSVSASDVSLAASGPLTLGAGGTVGSADGPVALRSGDAILLSGTVSTPGQLSLDAAAHVEQPGGRIAAGTLTGSAVELASLPSSTNAIGTLGRFALTGSTFVLVDGQPLVVQGPVTSGVIRIDAAGRLTLAGGQLVTRDALLRVLAGQDGTASLVQQGTTGVAAADGSAAALRLALPGGGTVSLNDLRAAGAGLVLDLGSGSATGNAALGSLLVLGTGGSANLFGTVAGRSDASAATVSLIAPRTDAAYLFNGCVIATACGNGSAVQTVTQGGTQTVVQTTIQGGTQTMVQTTTQGGSQTVVQTMTQNGVLIEVPVVAEQFPKSFQETLLGSLLRTNLFTVDLFSLGIVRDPADPNLVLPNISDRDY